MMAARAEVNVNRKLRSAFNINTWSFCSPAKNLAEIGILVHIHSYSIFLVVS